MVSEKSKRPEALLSQSVQERRKKYDRPISSFLLARACPSGCANDDLDTGSCVLCDCRQRGEVLQADQSSVRYPRSCSCDRHAPEKPLGDVLKLHEPLLGLRQRDWRCYPLHRCWSACSAGGYHPATSRQCWAQHAHRPSL